MANDDDRRRRRRAHSEEEEEEEERAAAAAAAADNDAEVTCKKTKIAASAARRDLLFDVLRGVAAWLDPPSFVCFREACSEWRSAAAAVAGYPHSQRKNSLLALSADPEADFRRLIGHSLGLELSDSYRFRCCGLFDDWIAAVTASGRVFLLRQVPATARVELPPISTLTLPPGFDEADNWRENPLYVKKITLSAPPDSPDCLAVALYWFNHLAVCRPGDAEWTAVREPSEDSRAYLDYYYKDAVFVAPRELIAVALRGRVVSFEFPAPSGSGGPPVATVLMPDAPLGEQRARGYSRALLANCGGEAVLVERSWGGFGFEVLKLAEDGRGGRRWEKQRGLELQGAAAAAAVVVSRCGCVCVPVEEAPGLEGNCVYFAEAREDKAEPLKAGVFGMGDERLRWVVEKGGGGMVPLMLFLFDRRTRF